MCVNYTCLIHVNIIVKGDACYKYVTQIQHYCITDSANVFVQPKKNKIGINKQNLLELSLNGLQNSAVI
jgi:hypothetical protein